MMYLFEIEKVVAGEFTLTYKEQDFTSFAAVKAAAERPERLVVKEIRADGAKLVVSVMDDPVVENDLNADWVKEHKAQFGSEPSFF